MASQRLTPQIVKTAYELLLGRAPESNEAVQLQIEQSKDERTLVANIAASGEFASRMGLKVNPQSPFWHFNASVDVQAIIESHIDSKRVPMSGHYVNFMGLAIPTRVMSFLKDRGGQMDPVPIPANFHADMAEWAGALRAVDLSGDIFTMIELGCGWGCWMSNTGIAARSRGKKLDLIGVEGDELHIGMARETFAVNGIKPDQYTIHKGIAAAAEGFALFTRRKGGEEGWGFEPKFGVSERESAAAVASGDFEREAMIPLVNVIDGRECIDLLHVDIQGGEDDLLRHCLPLLGERVAYIVIGTHSRAIEGRLIDALLGSAWRLEIERPAIVSLTGGAPVTTVDGVQAWSNPKYRQPT